MTPTTKAGRALHADPITRQVASYPHPEGVTDCWLCRHIVLVEREAAAEAEALRAALDSTETLPEDAPGIGTGKVAVWYERGWQDRGDAIRAALATPAPAARCEYPHQFGPDGKSMCPIHILCGAPAGMYDGLEGGRPWCVSPCPHAPAAPAEPER